MSASGKTTSDRRQFSHEVVHPVARCAKSDTIWTGAQGPNFSNDDPSAGSPAVAEVNDEQPDHADGSPTGTLLVRPVVGVLGKNDSDDDVAGRHTDRTDGQNGSATNTVDPQDGRDGSDEHDDADDTSGEKLRGVAALTELLEDGWGVVQHGIDTRPLLEEHGNTSNHRPLDHAPALEQGLDGDELELESVPGGLLAKLGEVLGDSPLLEERLSLDLKELELDELVVLGESSQTGEVGSSFRLAAVVDEPTGREWHEGHTAEENQARDDLEADGDEPGGIGLFAALGAADVVGSVVNPDRTVSSTVFSFTAKNRAYQKLIMIPKQIASCCRATRAPRTSLYFVRGRILGCKGIKRSAYGGATSEL